LDLLGVPVNQLTLSLRQGWGLIGTPYGGSSIADPIDDPTIRPALGFHLERG